MAKTKVGKRVLCLAACGLLIFAWVKQLHAMNNGDCLECHGDDSLRREPSEARVSDSLFVDAKKFKLSVHNINGVGCVDCHADIKDLDMSQDVPHPRDLDEVNCSSCHEAEGKAYLNSVHHDAIRKRIFIPCSACHGDHYVPYLEPASVFERENRFCLKCHDPHKFHDWLPQKETHFSFVECTVCHAPDSPRQIRLRLFDLIQNRFLSSTEILDSLKISLNEIESVLDKDKNGILSVEEFEDYVILLRHRGIRGTFHGELVSVLSPAIHHVNRGEAKSDCEMCHTPTSPFFQSVSLIFENEGGGLDHLPVERKVLETYFVSHFYALGGTRVRELDKIGIALVIGGLLVVLAHLSVRIMTTPMRKGKEKEKMPRAHRVASSINS